MRKTTILLLLLCTGMSFGAEAGDRVDRSLVAAPDGAVRVDLEYGRVRIFGSATDRVHVRGTIGERLSGIVLEREAGGVEIRARRHLWSRLRSLRGGSPPYRVDLTIEVPVASRLFVVSRDATITIEGIRGPIGVGVVTSTVVIRGEPAFVNAETASGSLDFEGRTLDLKATSLSGDLRVAGVEGLLTLEAATGALDVQAGPLRRARLETVSGRIEVRGAIEPGGSLEIDSVSGEVRLGCDAGVVLDLETRDGEIFNEWSDVEPLRDARGARVLKVAPQGSDGTARVRTRSGHIWLLPLDDEQLREKNE